MSDHALYAEARRATLAYLYPDPADRLAAQCRRYRREAGLTVRDIARNLAPSYTGSRARSWARYIVRKVERGNPRLSDLHTYALACGLTLHFDVQESPMTDQSPHAVDLLDRAARVIYQCRHPWGGDVDELEYRDATATARALRDAGLLPNAEQWAVDDHGVPVPYGSEASARRHTRDGRVVRRYTSEWRPA